MTLYQQLLTLNDCYRHGTTITPRGVMVHSTGTNNPYVCRYVPGNEELGYNTGGNDWNRPNISKCVHGFIGKVADGSVGTVQTLPWNWRGWHAGDGTSGKSANDTHIAFEICEDALKDQSYFKKVYREAVELTAYLCKMYGFDPLADGVVICHSEGYRRGIASNHADVEHWFPIYGKTMNDFRADVAREIKGEIELTEEQVRAIVREEYKKIQTETAALSASDWAKPYIREAIDAGLMADVGGTIDRPQAAVTRQELATTAVAILNAVK